MVEVVKWILKGCRAWGRGEVKCEYHVIWFYHSVTNCRLIRAVINEITHEDGKSYSETRSSMHAEMYAVD